MSKFTQNCLLGKIQSESPNPKEGWIFRHSPDLPLEIMICERHLVASSPWTRFEWLKQKRRGQRQWAKNHESLHLRWSSTVHVCAFPRGGAYSGTRKNCFDSFLFRVANNAEAQTKQPRGWLLKLKRMRLRAIVAARYQKPRGMLGSFKDASRWNGPGWRASMLFFENFSFFMPPFVVFSPALFMARIFGGRWWSQWKTLTSVHCVWVGERAGENRWTREWLGKLARYNRWGR